jgi:hypothetical protein
LSEALGQAYLSHHAIPDEIERFVGINWLASFPPEVSAITWTVPGTSLYDFLPGLLVRGFDEHAWLILDDDEEERRRGTLRLRDKVYTTIQGDDHMRNEFGFTEWDRVDLSWIQWQRRIWAKTEAAAERGPPLEGDCEITYGDPLNRPQEIIANSWINRFNPRPDDSKTLIGF